MKQLTLEETRLKEEMKQRCLSKGQYTDENAKAKFEMLCHLEDFEIQYWELQEENKQLNGAVQTYDILLKANVEENKQLKENWNNLREVIRKKQDYYRYVKDNRYRKFLSELLGKMEELEQRNHINE